MRIWDFRIWGGKWMKNNKEERESNAESITATVHRGWWESLGIGSIVNTRRRTSTGELFPGLGSEVAESNESRNCTHPHTYESLSVSSATHHWQLHLHSRGEWHEVCPKTRCNSECLSNKKTSIFFWETPHTFHLPLMQGTLPETSVPSFLRCSQCQYNKVTIPDAPEPTEPLLSL